LPSPPLFDSQFDAVSELPHSGSALENPCADDATARELKQMAVAGGIEILTEQSRSVADELLICHLTFRRTTCAESARMNRPGI
jgi:hypothetical protein